MAQKTETVFRKRVRDFLQTLKHTTAFAIQQVTIRGVPDFLLCSNGMFVGLELKAKDGSLSELQKYNLAQIEKCGGVAMVASPLNWDEIKVRLEFYDRRKG